MADLNKEIYNRLASIEKLMLNSVKAMLDDSEEQTKVLISIADMLSEKGNDKKDTTVSDKAAGGIKNLFTDAFTQGFKAFVDVLPKFFKGIKQFDDIDTEKFTTFISDMNSALTLDGKYDDPKKLAEFYKAVGGLYEVLGTSITGFSKGLIWFTVADKLKGPEKFMIFTNKFFDKDNLSKLDPKKAKQAGDAYRALGDGILKFSIAMALSTPLLLIGLPAIAIGLPVMMGLLMFYSFLSKFTKPVHQGVGLLKDMGLGILAFSASLLLMRFVQPRDILMASMVMVVFAGFVALMMLVSKIGGAKDMKRMSESLLMMSIGVGLFAFAILAYRLVEPADILKAMMSIGVMAVALYILGKSGANVLVGALALMVASFAVGMAAFAIMMYKDVTDEELKKAGLTFGVMVLGIKLLGNPWALAGAAAIAIVALSLAYSFKIVFDSLAKFKEIGWTENDTAVLSGTFTGLLTGIAKPITGGGVLDGIKTVVGGAYGSGVLAMLGLALLPLTEGLKTFKESGFTKEDAELMGVVFDTLLKSVKKPIEDIGSTATFFTRSDFARGVSSLKGLGGAIYDLAKGVRDMANLTFIDPVTKQPVTLGDAEFTAAGENISRILNAVKGPIIEIGKTSSTGGEGSWQRYFSEPDFENGMEAVGGLGKWMFEIAEGVQRMSNLTFIDPVTKKPVTLGDTEFTNAGLNIERILNAVKTPIMEIGKTASGGYFSEPDFENGMEAVNGLGKFMMELAEGVQQMSNLTFMDPITKKPITLGDTEFTNAGLNIERVLSAVKTPIMDIGKQASGGYFSDPDFKNGMEAVGGLGKFMLELAGGVKAMSQNMYVDPTDPTKFIEIKPETYTQVGANIGLLLDAIRVPISKLGEGGGWFSKPEFKKGLESMKGVSAELVGLTEAMSKIQEIQGGKFTPMDTENYLRGVVKAFTGPFDNDKLKASDAETITGSYRKMIDDVVKLAKHETALGRVATHLDKISKSMIDVVSAFDKMGMEKLEKSTDFFNTLVEIEKINADTFKAKIEETRKLIEQFEPQPPAVATPTPASNAAQNDPTLQRMKFLEDSLIAMMDMFTTLNTTMSGINNKLAGNLSVDVKSVEGSGNIYDK